MVRKYEVVSFFAVVIALYTKPGPKYPPSYEEKRGARTHTKIFISSQGFVNVIHSGNSCNASPKLLVSTVCME